jgi:hypothetical protein
MLYAVNNTISINGQFCNGHFAMYISHYGSFWPAFLQNKSAYETIMLSVCACLPVSALDTLKYDYSAIGGQHDVIYLISYDQ